jgi:hypothetical protein
MILTYGATFENEKVYPKKTSQYKIEKKPYIVQFNSFNRLRRRHIIANYLHRKSVCLMINFDLGPAQVLGSLIILLSCSLYSTRINTPKISRDSDIVIFSVGSLVGIILVFQGWRLDPLLLFGQIMTTIVALCFALETLKLRSLIADRYLRKENSANYNRKFIGINRHVCKPQSRNKIKKSEIIGACKSNLKFPGLMKSVDSVVKSDDSYPSSIIKQQKKKISHLTSSKQLNELSIHKGHDDYKFLLPYNKNKTISKNLVIDSLDVIEFSLSNSTKLDDFLDYQLEK